MLTRTAVITGLAVALGIVGAGAQDPQPESADKEIQEFTQEMKKELPKIRDAFSALQAAPEQSSAVGPLPEPSLTEPFEIGEALYDEGRAANAIVSLLALMKIAVVPDANASARATGVTLSESEVRALIDLAEEDLQASENDMERLPYKFTDLHAGIADLLPGVTVEALAEAYTKAYGAHPDDLIAKAMMGRPIEPETTLTRAQLWFLLMDGFAGAAAGGRWGTADREAPDLKPPDDKWSPEEFREVLARLPLLTASRLVTLSAPDAVSIGATAGPPVNVTARVAASAPPLVSRATGRTLLAARAGSLSGQEVSWSVHPESMLPELGKILTAVDEPLRVASDGVARFVIQPGLDPTRGKGQLISEWESIEARFDRRGLVASAYTVPAPVAGLTLGSTRARANILMRWRSPDVLYLVVSNRYRRINFDLPLLGGGTRNGRDRLHASLSKRSDGTYRGPGVVDVQFGQVLRSATGIACPDAVTASQRVHVKVEPQSGFGPTHVLDDFVWVDGQLNRVGGTMATTRPDGGYYRVIIYPVSREIYSGWCIQPIPAGTDRRGWGANSFIPLNDAQWTTSGQGYGIALKSQGLTAYLDRSSQDPLAGTPLAGLKAGLKLTGSSMWLVLAAASVNDLPSGK